MTTCSSIDLDRTTAVVEWQWNGVTCSLATPDPSNASVQFTIRLDSTRLRTMYALFEIVIPIKLKDAPGSTAIYLRICPSSIASFEFCSSTAVSEAIKKRFDSVALCLDFRLKKNPAVLIPSSIREPVAVSRGRSGRVLDAIYQLSRVTALSIHIKDAILSHDDLKSISNGVNQSRFKPFANPDYDISRMYGGKGAKITTLAEPQPPPYTEDASPPPSNVPARDRKRARQSTDDEQESISQIWAKLRTISKRDAMRTTVIEALQQENLELRADNAALRARITVLEQSHQILLGDVAGLRPATTEGGDATLRESVTFLEASYEDLEEEVEKLKELAAELGDLKEVEVNEMQEEIDNLTTRVEFIEEGKDDDAFLERVTGQVLHEMGSRLLG
ncbi:hypothetical protein ACHAPT_013622 [Fusarium lateritium]